MDNNTIKGCLTIKPVTEELARTKTNQRGVEFQVKYVPYSIIKDIHIIHLQKCGNHFQEFFLDKNDKDLE